MSKIEEVILVINFIMEVFGNVKMMRNDNFLWFGKYIEIMFDKEINIIGVKIRIYLLEWLRLVFQLFKERNYYIFYQFVVGVMDKECQELGLLFIEQFDYFNQGNILMIDGVDDKVEFKVMKQLLMMIGVSEGEQVEIFKLFVGLFYFGNVKIGVFRMESVFVVMELLLVKVCEIFGIDVFEFVKWIVKKQFVICGEKIILNLL